ncbi:MAG: pyridoxamine 5'-phosphate oxidase family protein [Anaerolineales bacterium]|nr:pyridoxamine 5'-phosphate oxidase family protein [Anaerolineales bacterium]
MTKDDTQQPFNRIRRQDRAKDDAWIRAFLRRAPFGSMATVCDGQPFIVARKFAYDKAAHAIYLHGAAKGRTYENVQADGRVCFSASEMGRLLPAKRAMNFSMEYFGVVVFGRAVIVTDAVEAKHGLQLIMDKYFPHLRPGEDYEPATDTDLKVTAVYRIDIESWSGKEKRVEEGL